MLEMRITATSDEPDYPLGTLVYAMEDLMARLTDRSKCEGIEEIQYPLALKLEDEDDFYFAHCIIERREG